MTVVDLPPGTVFHHVRLDLADVAFAAELHACVTLRAGATVGPPGEAERRTSREALEQAVADGDVSDIRVDPGLTNCQVLHTGGLPGSVVDDRMVDLRHLVDGFVATLIGQPVAVSGHFLYPPGGYMGWHTNSRVPGRRLYLSYVAEPGRSFFRYRDPDSSEVVTTWDNGLDLRVFDIDRSRPLWHAVYSDTYRLSFGYRVG
jgi:hypothetical protein